MRLHHALAVPAAAFALALSMPGAASAAGGDFTYRYQNDDGEMSQAALMNPQSGVCLNLPEVRDPADAPPAEAPVNHTDRAATVFSEPGCQGHHHTIEPGAQPGKEQPKVRSVMFSDTAPKEQESVTRRAMAAAEITEM